MGDQHDVIVEKSLRGEADYDESQVVLALSVSERFNYVRPFLEKVCGVQH